MSEKYPWLLKLQLQNPFDISPVGYVSRNASNAKYRFGALRIANTPYWNN